MKGIYLRVFLLFWSAYLQESQIFCQLASWNFENVSGPIPNIPILPSELGAGIASAGGGLSGAQNSGSPTTCASPETWATNFWPTTAVRSTGSYMSFMVTASEGYRANISGVSFMLSRSSSSAPSDYYVSIFRWGIETFITSGVVPISGCNNFSGTCNISGTSGGSLEVRIYLFRQNSAAMTATMRIDNVSLSGTTEVALPVSLGLFSGHCNEQNLPNLTWETYSESKNHGFWVQQAFSDLVFNDVFFVTGYGESQSKRQYNWQDFQEKRGLIYYRLKQIDYDGMFAYSKIIPVSCEQGEILITQQDNASISIFLGDQTGQFEEWTLLHSGGHRIQAGKIDIQYRQIKITCPNIRTGIYILLLSGKRGNVVKKISWVE
ncbi:MAG: hypothetical protein KGQ50_08435 [Bacteroidetes bacterium]|nr:hypothetical protein [Bacteroidota bacterium]